MPGRRPIETLDDLLWAELDALHPEMCLDDLPRLVDLPQFREVFPMPAPPLTETLSDPLLATFDSLPNHQHLTATQVAALLQVTTRFLERCRNKGLPPPWVTLSHHCVRYVVGDLRTWIQWNREHAPTSTYDGTTIRQLEIMGLVEVPKFPMPGVPLTEPPHRGRRPR